MNSMTYSLSRTLPEFARHQLFWTSRHLHSFGGNLQGSTRVITIAAEICLFSVPQTVPWGHHGPPFKALSSTRNSYNYRSRIP